MKEIIFWDRKTGISKIKKILKKENHPRFIEFAALLLSRTNKIRDVFSEYLDKVVFCKNWRSIKRRMRENKWNDERIIFWDEIYKAVLRKEGIKLRTTRERPLSRHPQIKKVADIIKTARKEKGWSQKELAKKIGFSQQTISFVERGYLNFSFETLIKISDALGLKISISPEEKDTPYTRI